MKKCTACDKIKSFEEFSFRKDNKKFRNQCKVCVAKKTKEWREQPENDGKYKLWYDETRIERNKTRRIYGGKNKEKTSVRNKIYTSKPENKVKIRKNKREYYHKVLKNSPEYKLRKSCNRMINNMIKSQGSEKSFSFLKHVPYTLGEFRKHIENLWEPWMNWDNYGTYRRGHDRKWNIDHIIPQALLPYKSMKSKNFKKCWALSNLRPLDALSNIKKGNKKCMK